MADMEYSFDRKNWYPVYDGMPLNSTIPGGATDVHFRQKPEWNYQVTRSGADGFSENYEHRHHAMRKVDELQDAGRDCTLYIRNLNK